MNRKIIHIMVGPLFHYHPAVGQPWPRSQPHLRLHLPRRLLRPSPRRRAPTPGAGGSVPSASEAGRTFKRPRLLCLCCRSCPPPYCRNVAPWNYENDLWLFARRRDWQNKIGRLRRSPGNRQISSCSKFKQKTD